MEAEKKKTQENVIEQIQGSVMWLCGYKSEENKTNRKIISQRVANEISKQWCNQRALIIIKDHFPLNICSHSLGNSLGSVMNDGVLDYAEGHVLSEKQCRTSPAWQGLGQQCFSSIQV